MKKLIIIIAASLVSCIFNLTYLQAQTLSPKANPTSGGYYNAGGNSLSWTMGETYNTTISSAGNKLTQGEQQPDVPTGGCTAAPTAPVSITGPSVVCGVASTIYSVTPISGAVTYNWTVPTGTTGMTITSGQGTTSLHVTISAGTTTGNVTCSATNACGTSAVTSLAVTKKPAVPGVISGPTNICGLTNATYFISPVFGATSYTWTIPAGMTLTAGAGTTSVTVSIASTFTLGGVSVNAVNACGNVPGTSLLVYGKIAPNLLTGPTNVCGMNTATYTCNTVANATSYLWTIPSSWTFTGQGTNTIVATLPANTNNVTYSGTVKVHAVSGCGNSADKALTVSYCKSAIAMNNGDETKSVSIYPNPTSGELGIMNYELGIKNVEVYDMLGKCIYKSEITNEQSTINISQLSNGMYFVKLVDENNNTVYAEKIVKQ